MKSSAVFFGRRFWRNLGFVVLTLVIILSGLYMYAGHVTASALKVQSSYSAIEGLESAIAAADLESGRRTAHIRTGCADCHGEDLGGKVFIDDPPFGRLYAPNLTPFALKSWSDNEIAHAIREAVHPNHRALILMPSHEFVNFSLEDLGSLIAYLRSLPAVDRENQGSHLGPVPKILYALGKMPTLIPTHIVKPNQEFQSSVAETESVEFGRYIAQTSCMGCHGPQYEGGPVPGGPPDWPPATNLRLDGKPNWTEASFVRALKEGVSAESGQPVRPPMPIAQTQQMTDTELKALWLFFSSLD